jgi:Glycosyltransferase (GlcNAc)
MLSARISLNHGNNLIFVSIAAYRDRQLVPTIEDCIAKAADPYRLRFGICWQHGAGDDPLLFTNDDCFRILDVDWRDSKGACWARAEVMKLWRGEAWLLQVDSHCRFAHSWDEKLIRSMVQTGSPKPVLSTYATAFVPGDDEVLVDGPLQMAFQGFTAEGIPYMKPVPISDWQNRSTPLRARFLSAGFLFAPGSFVEEVRYDPELYFLGEEATMTVRAFTNGYDLFHPCETILWHDYVRANATKHWEDHTETNNVSQKWHELDLISKNKIKRMLGGEAVESFGLGSVRTLEEYERYAGLSFRLRRAQDYTVRYEEPPNPETTSDWTADIYTWMVRITLERAALPDGALEDPVFWYVGIKGEDGIEIHRKDILKNQVDTFPKGEPTLVLVLEFQSGTIPATWSIWPVSRTLGWLSKIEGRLAEEDYTIVMDDPE